MPAYYRAASLLLFFVSTVLIYGVAVFILQHRVFGEEPHLIATAITLDLTVLVPLLYYALLVRQRGWPVVSVAPVILLSLFAASRLLPASYHHALNVMEVLALVVEAGVVVLGVRKAAQIIRLQRSHPGDFYDRLRPGLREALGSRLVADVLASEIAVVYYALRPPAKPGSEPRAFSYHRRSTYPALLMALLLVAAVELVGVHVLLLQWSAVAAWVHVGLSCYGLLWLLGDYRAMRARPVVVDKDCLRLRTGLRWNAALSWNDIEGLWRVKDRSVVQEVKAVRLTPMDPPNYLIMLKTPVTVTGPFGLTRETTAVALWVDEPERFEQAVVAQLRRSRGA